MIFCNNELITIFSVIKIIYRISCMGIFIGFIFSIIIHLFKGIISKNNEGIGKLIINKTIMLIILFLLPTLIFWLFNMFIPEEVFNIETIKNCWHSS